MSEGSAAKAQAGKTGGSFQAPPPPNNPKEWRAIGVIQYKADGDLFEFRVVSTENLPKELRETLHEKHGIAAISWEDR